MLRQTYGIACRNGAARSNGGSFIAHHSHASQVRGSQAHGSTHLIPQHRLAAKLVPTSCAGAGHIHPSQEQQAMISSSTDQPSPNPSMQQVVQSLPLPPGLIEAVMKMSTFLSTVLGKVRAGVASVFPQIDQVTAEDVHKQLQRLKGNLSVLAIVAPLARAGGSESLTALYARTFERAAFGFAKMYLFCLFMRVLLSWFPGIDWNAQPWTFLRLITEPYLQIYRGILPPLFGQLDFTPLFGFLILQDVVEVMAPTFTMGLHDHDTSTRWTTSDVMCYFDGF